MIKVVRLFEDNMINHEMAMIDKLDLDIDFSVRPSFSEDEVIENAYAADVIICVYEPLTKRVLQALPNLKLVMYRSIGFNSIDMDYANEIKLPVSHISQYCTDEVANYVLSAILMHNRRLNDFNYSVKVDRKWDCELYPGMRRLSSLTVGLIGFGNIPKLITKRLMAFGPKVIAYDPYVTDDVFAEYEVERVELEDIFKNSDYISCHLPLNKATENIINGSLLNLVKEDSVFINSSRGGVVKEEDLLNSLKSGNLGYAILDVLSTEEPDLYNNELLNLENVVITPHVAFYSQEAFIQGAEDNMKNLAEFLNGKAEKAEIVNLNKIS